LKKIGFIVLTMVMVLGTLGVSYALWSDTVTVDGNVETGSVCWEFVCFSAGSVFPDYPDRNCFYDLNGGYKIITGGPFPPSYPPDYPRPDAKDVAHTTVNIPCEVPHPKVLEVTVENGYPYYFDHIGYAVHYCGTIPGRIQEAVIKIRGVPVATFNEDSTSYVYLDFDEPKATFINPGLEDTEYEMEFWWGNRLYMGQQIHYCEEMDHSFYILIRQPAPQNAGVEGSGIPPLTFTIEYTVVQWDSYQEP
jgi:predicted ribosomally synthesized peptide with SipW-like signal peptide